MSEIFNAIKERILLLAENQEVKKSIFFKKIKSSYSNFVGNSKKSSPSADILNKISTTYPNVNPEWLLTGKGAMMRHNNFISDGIPLLNFKILEKIEKLNFSILSKNDVESYYIIPDFEERKVNFMIKVHGDSMSPKYNNGDILACSAIKETSFIQWNKAHVIITKEQGVIVNRIKNSNNNLLMISENKDYDSFEINKKDIIGLAIVKGLIRIE